jgi:hypothetical protein
MPQHLFEPVPLHGREVGARQSLAVFELGLQRQQRLPCGHPGGTATGMHGPFVRTRSAGPP